MRRPAIVLLGGIVAFGLVATIVAITVEEPAPPPGAPLGERIYYRYCAHCHGRDGRGSWRATIFLIRTGDLTDASRMQQNSDRYLFELIKLGGAPLGKPGMPGFAFQLTDQHIEAVIAYVRNLPGDARAR